MEIRPHIHQEIALSKGIKALKDRGNTLIIAPTGAGKTIILSMVLKTLFNLGWIKKACVLAHRNELISQNREKFHRVSRGITSSVFNADSKDWSGQVVFPMVQTLTRNLSCAPAIDLLIIDESHHAIAKSYTDIIDALKLANPRLLVLGVTATPNRGDKKGLRPIFDNVSHQIEIGELIDGGFLAKPRTHIIELSKGLTEDLSKVKKLAGEYNMSAVESLMNTEVINDAVIKHWKTLAGDRQTVIFCSNIKHVESVNKAFCEAGIRSCAIHSHLSEDTRRQTLADYEQGLYEVVVNADVLTEGWDHPATSCVVLLRPSSHQGAYIQMIGRGLRPCEGKQDCLILDFGMSTLKHGSIEQTVELDDIPLGSPPTKTCHNPACEAIVPISCRYCGICGHPFETSLPKEKKELKSHEFIMREIDFFIKAAKYEWVSFYDADTGFYVAGMSDLKVGAFLMCHESTPENVMLSVKLETHIGNVQDLTSMDLREAEKFMFSLYPHPIETARKGMSWHNQPPTYKQLEQIPPKSPLREGLTKYRACVIIGFKFLPKDKIKKDYLTINNKAEKKILLEQEIS